MVGPLRPMPCSWRCRSSWMAAICVGSRPTHIGPSTVSMAARVAGKIRWPNDSPHPVTPPSVSTRTSSTSMLVTARSRSFGVAPSMTIGTADVETVGLGELHGIAVGGADEGHDHLASRDGAAADGHVLARDARGALHGSVVAQQLLDGAADERGVLLQPAQLIAMA